MIGLYGTVYYATCFQALLQIAHHVELKKENESEKWRRHIKLLTPEEVANLVRIRDNSFCFTAAVA